jgi:hypothetical protein
MQSLDPAFVLNCACLLQWRGPTWKYTSCRLEEVVDLEPLPAIFAGKQSPSVALVSRFLTRIYRCVDRFLVRSPYRSQGQCELSPPCKRASDCGRGEDKVARKTM